MIGRVLGRYRIVGKLGEGGLASVWRAQDELLRRTVAVKILDAKWSEFPEAVRRFLHEGQSTAALSHPGIVALYDSGMDGGTPYLVLECLEGEVLADRISRSLMPIPEAVRVARAVADALDYAHRHGVIHRDVTARNVILGPHRRTVVLDFGLALAAWETRLTATGVRMGTLGYVPPELLRGLEADARSDQYERGVLLYEMLTGSKPYATSNAAALVHRAMTEDPPPPSSRRPDIPADLDAVVLRALARERGERFADMRELAAALAAAPEPSRPVAAPTAARSFPAGPPRVPDPLYLAIAPFRAEGVEALGSRLEFVLRALLQRSGARIVPWPAEPSADPALAAKTAGANALLEAVLARDASRIRVEFAATDLLHGLQFAGDRVEGSEAALFDLEDAFAAAISSALGLVGTIAPAPGRAPDPAREELLLQALASIRRHDSVPMIEGAIGLLEDLLAAEPESARLHAALGRACLRKYRITKLREWEARAARAIERALELEPDGTAVHLALGELHVETGAHAAAIAELELVLAREPGNADAEIGRGRAYLALGRLEEAEAAARAALRGDAGDWRGWSLLGLVLYHANRYEDALAAWQEVVRLTPDNAVGYRDLGSCYYRLERHDEAADAYRRSLEIQPNAYAYSSLGTLLFFQGAHEAATDALRKAAHLRPADPYLWGNLGNACRWIAGREGESADALDRAIGLAAERLARNGADYEMWAKQAEWLAGRGRAEEARAAIARARELAPDDVDVIARAVHVHVDLGEIDESVRNLREAVALGYPVTEFRRSTALRPLHGHPEFKRIVGP